MTPAQRFAGFALAGAIMGLDGFDIVAMPLAAPHVMPQFGLSASQMGLVFSALLVGLGLGAMFLAPLGDRFGRRWAVLAGTVMLALTTLGSATGTSALQFAAWRLCVGLALGLCLTNATALVAELARPEKRAFAVALASTGMSLGVIIAGLLAPWLIERGGWQMVFLAPGLTTAVIAVLVWAGLPETRVQQSSEAGVPRAPSPTISLLLRPPLRAPLLHFGLLYGISAAAMYWFTNWLPVVLPRAGMDTTVAAHNLSLAQTGSLAAGVLIGWFVDRGSGRMAFSLCYIAVIGACLMFSFLPPLHWTALVLVVGGGIAGAHLAIVPMATRQFPSEVLSSAIGVGVAITRVGAVLGSIAGGQLLEAGVRPERFLGGLAIPVFCCLLLASLMRGVRTS